MHYSDGFDDSHNATIVVLQCKSHGLLSANDHLGHAFHQLLFMLLRADHVDVQIVHLP